MASSGESSRRLLRSQTILSSLPPTLTLRATPSTDIWSVPPNVDHFSAPFAVVALPTGSFRSLTATIIAPSFSANTQQAGLLLTLPSQSSAVGSPTEQSRRWVTATLEFEHGHRNISVVSCVRWADWSLGPWESERATLKMERRGNEQGEMGPRLIVSIHEPAGWRIIREVTWAFEEEGGEIWVGLLANQASGVVEESGAEGAEVYFKDIVLQTSL